jgi:uncharacterized protein
MTDQVRPPPAVLHLRERGAESSDGGRRLEFTRLFRWPQGQRPDDHPGLSELGL